MGSIYRPPLRSDELMHYGVKGMKWGVRKRRENVNRFYSQHDQKRKININGKKIAAGVGIAAGTALASYGAYRLHKSGKGRELLEKGVNGYNRLRNSRGMQRARNLWGSTRKVRRAASGVLDAVEVAQKGKYVYDNRERLKTKEGRKSMIEQQKKVAKTKKWRRKQIGSLAVSAILKT